MHKKLSTKFLCVLGGALFLFNGCTGFSISRCSSSTPSQGTFCYQGYNFGKNINAIYRQGVRDGCHTANGNFSKDYALSANSATYTEGWNKGRATCKLIPPSEADIGTMRTQYQQSIDEKRYYGI